MIVEKRVKPLLVQAFIPFNVIGLILLFTEFNFLGFITLLVSILTLIFQKDFFILSLYYYKILKIQNLKLPTKNPYIKYYLNILEDANLGKNRHERIFNPTQNLEKEKDLFFAIKLFNIEFLNYEDKYKQIQNLNLSKSGYISLFQLIFSEIMEKEPKLLTEHNKPIESSRITLAVSELIKLNTNNENFIDCLRHDLPEIENIKNNLPEKTNIFTIIENKDLIEGIFKEHEEQNANSLKENQVENETLEDVVEDTSWKI